MVYSVRRYYSDKINPKIPPSAKSHLRCIATNGINVEGALAAIFHCERLWYSSGCKILNEPKKLPCLTSMKRRVNVPIKCIAIGWVSSTFEQMVWRCEEIKGLPFTTLNWMSISYLMSVLCKTSLIVIKDLPKDKLMVTMISCLY